MILYKNKKKIQKFADGGTVEFYHGYTPQYEQQATSGSGGNLMDSYSKYKKPRSPYKPSSTKKGKPSKLATNIVGTKGAQRALANKTAAYIKKLASLDPNGPGFKNNFDLLQLDLKKDSAAAKYDVDSFKKALGDIKTNKSESQLMVDGDSVFYIKKGEDGKGAGDVERVDYREYIKSGAPLGGLLTVGQMAQVKDEADSVNYKSLYLNSNISKSLNNIYGEQKLMDKFKSLASGSGRIKVKKGALSIDGTPFNSNAFREFADGTLVASNTDSLTSVFGEMVKTVNSDAQLRNSMYSSAIRELGDTLKKDPENAENLIQNKVKQKIADYLTRYISLQGAGDPKGKGSGSSGADGKTHPIATAVEAALYQGADDTDLLGFIEQTSERSADFKGTKIASSTIPIRDEIEKEISTNKESSDNDEKTLKLYRVSSLNKVRKDDGKLFTVDGVPLSNTANQQLNIARDANIKRLHKVPHMKDSSGKYVPAIKEYGRLAKATSKYSHLISTIPELAKKKAAETGGNPVAISKSMMNKTMEAIFIAAATVNGKYDSNLANRMREITFKQMIMIPVTYGGATFKDSQDEQILNKSAFTSDLKDSDINSKAIYGSDQDGWDFPIFGAGNREFARKSYVVAYAPSQAVTVTHAGGKVNVTKDRSMLDSFENYDAKQREAVGVASLLRENVGKILMSALKN